MQDKIRLLIELQKIDSVILAKRKIIDMIPSKLQSADNILKDVQSQYDKQKQKCEAGEKKKREKEQEVEEINDRINKLKSRTSEIKTNKEYQAHLKEIENIEKERYAAEDEILSAMEAIESASKELKAEEAKLKAEKEKVEVFRKSVEKEMAEAERELNDFKAQRSETVKTIDPDMYKDYMAALKMGAGLAVVEAKNEVCQGCNINIPPQLFVEIKKNEEIIQCPQCRRILYWSETPEEKEKSE